MTEMREAQKRPKSATDSRSHALPHFTPAERAARGEAQRAEARHCAHGERDLGRIGAILSICSKTRREPVCRSFSRSATGASWSRRFAAGGASKPTRARAR